jgi:multidrug efflux pump subunit AcrA (membrane-fusion protein)
LNEVDIAKIKLGQKTTVTFDAIEDLTLTGEVVEIDSVGTVSQGVVSYVVKINFDTNDDRIKPGMSISASIITNTAQDVLVIPSSAVKTKNGISYVEKLDKSLSGSSATSFPAQTKVEIGLSDDSKTEIISGLNEGDFVVTKTVSGSNSLSTKTTSSKSTNTNLMGMPEMGVPNR